jgi:hypothetical protein
VNRTLIAQQLRESTDKGDCMKLQSFCTAKEMITRLKRQPTEWEKSFPVLHVTRDHNQNIKRAQEKLTS